MARHFVEPENALRSNFIRNSMYFHSIKCDALLAVAGHEFTLFPVVVAYKILIILYLCDKLEVQSVAHKESARTSTAEFNNFSTVRDLVKTTVLAYIHTHRPGALSNPPCT